MTARRRDDVRPPRSGALRRSGPGRRRQQAQRAAPSVPRAADQVWELWNLRALQPDAQPADLENLRRRRAEILAGEREALARLWSGDQGLLSPGRSFLAARPELRSGLVVSVHTGPYQLLAEPWLAAGLRPLILLNAEVKEIFTTGTDAMIRRLRLPGRVEWAAVGEPGFMRSVVAAARAQRPVLVYLDGNNGQDGMPGTRAVGLRYRLPGRDIRLRTGVARLACRLECPVHPVALHWEAGRIVWEVGPAWRWRRATDPQDATREMYAWAFGQILARPEQWHFWSMLKDSSACFGASLADGGQVPVGLREDFARAFHICCEKQPGNVRLILEKDVAVWPGGVLADLTADRFYPAAGLADEDLEPLRNGAPTLTALEEHHGQAWVRFHGLRLCLLGMARLGG